MTQEAAILEYLKAGNSISPLEALSEFGCFRLASVIHALRQRGHSIVTKTAGNGRKKWANYHLSGAYKYQPVYAHQQPGYGE